MFRSMVALAFIGSVAIASSAQAASETYAIPAKGFDLTVGKDKARFDERIEIAARQLCSSPYKSPFDLSRDECVKEVRDEANANLETAIRKTATQNDASRR